MLERWLCCVDHLRLRMRMRVRLRKKGINGRKAQREGGHEWDFLYWADIVVVMRCKVSEKNLAFSAFKSSTVLITKQYDEQLENFTAGQSSAVRLICTSHNLLCHICMQQAACTESSLPLEACSNCASS